MNDTIKRLLEPIASDKPCGPDLSYDKQFEKIETLSKGKPEVEIGNLIRPAEPPEWGGLCEVSSDFLTRSKHLRVAVFFACGMLKTNGIAGFRDGLWLIQNLVEKYWADLHPLLDPEDNNDPTQRLSILSTLVLPRGSFGAGWITVQDYLYAAPICVPKGSTPVTYDSILSAKSGGLADGAGIADALRTNAEQANEAVSALTEAASCVDALDRFLTSTLSASNTISLDPLSRLLGTIASTIQGLIGTGAGAVETGEATSELVGNSRGEPETSGSIRGPDDVVRELERICDYYRRVEPGSPVLYFLKRAQKLSKMDFIETMAELNLMPLESLRPVLGSTMDSNISKDLPGA